jgi:hypothetical protein
MAQGLHGRHGTRGLAHRLLQQTESPLCGRQQGFDFLAQGPILPANRRQKGLPIARIHLRSRVKEIFDSLPAISRGARSRLRIA